MKIFQTELDIKSVKNKVPFKRGFVKKHGPTEPVEREDTVSIHVVGVEISIRATVQVLQPKVQLNLLHPTTSHVGQLVPAKRSTEDPFNLRCIYAERSNLKFLRILNSTFNILRNFRLPHGNDQKEFSSLRSFLSDREGHGHKAVLYKSHFPATSVHSCKRDTIVYIG